MSEENRTDQRKTREMLHYDEICKHLLSYKPILARILKECVEEYHDLSYEAIQACIEPDLKGAHMHIIGRNTEDLTIPEAKILYDLLFTAALPKQKEQVALFINIEAQNRDDPSYPLLKRALYDGSRLLAGQKGEQHGFEHSSYGEIKKVYTIWLCFGHAKKKADVINRYRIEEKQERGNWKSEKADYDVLEVVMVYPGERTPGRGGWNDGTVEGAVLRRRRREGEAAGGKVWYTDDEGDGKGGRSYVQSEPDICR